MRNPLNRRIIREFKTDLGKYFVIFMFLIMLISAVSAFLVADSSVTKAYNDGFHKYNLEDGHLAFNMQLPKEIKSQLEEKADISLFELTYFEENINDENKTVRVYKDRKVVDKVCLMEGQLPEKDKEIALDRLFAVNNEIAIGDTIKLGKKELTVTGYVALPDYSCLFEKNSDMMFNAQCFGVAIMTEEGFDVFDSKHVTYNYAWTYPEFVERTDKKSASEKSEVIIDALEEVIKDYDEDLVDDAIAAGKLVMLAEVLEEMKDGLKTYGMDISMYDSQDGYEQLLKEINESLEREGINLSDKFTEGEREVTLTTSDIEAAMKAGESELQEAQDVIDTIENRILEVKDYLPRYENQAINFTGDDMSGDKSMFLAFAYIVIGIIAFVFAVTVRNTIVSEAGVIGTLRASGYSRFELLCHYMVLPVIVTLVAAVIGNIIGYGPMKEYMVDMYFNSYSLATYETVWSPEAFVDTTLIPIIIMLVVNVAVLVNKLRLSPLRFLRHDLSKRGRRKAFRLNTKIPIMHRFRIRIVFQNIFDYLVLLMGIFVGGVLVIYGLMFTPLLEDVGELMKDSRLSDYQYVIMNEAETDNGQAEKFAMTSLESTFEGYMTDEISIYGILPDSIYFKEEIPEGKVIVSEGILKKYGLKEGDTICLKDAISEKEYQMEIASGVEYYATMSVFMNYRDYLDTFEEEEDYFTGYFSNEKLTDIDEDDIYTIISVKDLTKVSDQLLDSVGSFMVIIKYFGVILFVLLMYILTKQIIEKNSVSISMTKILGYTNGEIGGLYLLATSIFVLVSLFISIPIIEATLQLIFKELLYTEMTGYIPYMIDKSCYIKMVVIGMASFAVVAAIEMLRINKIPKADALKNVE